MFRAFSTTKNRHNYNMLEDDDDEQPFMSENGLVLANLKRLQSVPAAAAASKDLQHPQYQQQRYSLKDQKQYKFGFSTKRFKGNAASDVTPLQRKSISPAKLAKKASKIHPLFGLFDPKSKKKTISRAEFGRYLEYVKEGGLWGMSIQTE